MKLNILFLLVIIPFTKTAISSPKYDINNPVERYCGVIEAIAKTVGNARDKNMQQDKVLAQIVHIDIISNSAQLQLDAKEIINVIPSDKNINIKKNLNEFSWRNITKKYEGMSKTISGAVQVLQNN